MSSSGLLASHAVYNALSYDGVNRHAFLCASDETLAGDPPAHEVQWPEVVLRNSRFVRTPFQFKLGFRTTLAF